MAARYLIYTLCLFMIPLAGATQEIQIKDNFFFLDGDKFFIKGIGYEVGATPGHLPWTHTFDPDILRADIERILSGGFNTIRTWAAFTEEELTVLAEYDLKIIMGIWIDPHGDFSDPAFVSAAQTTVNNVLSYSKNHDNIIAYLIMNEPLPETIAAAGYDATVSLWSQLMSQIHLAHPGRPVSIANTSNGTYINPAVFDFSAYNVYIYNPVTVNYLYGFRDFVRYLRELNTPHHPLVLTEYGLSVSPSGPGNWGYGGNTLAEQQQGIIEMYGALVDGGAAGSFVFNYSDGWWKSGNEFVHDDAAEEWFGLVEYSNLADQYGHVRPVWSAIKAFQSAIITEPRTADIYGTNVPIEIFLDDTIARVEVYDGMLLLDQWQASGRYLHDTLSISAQGISAFRLTFKCYDGQNHLVKTEEKSILITTSPVSLPEIDIDIANSDYWESGHLEVDYHINRGTKFTTSSDLEYIYYPHVGFDYGQQFTWTMPNQEIVDLHSQHGIAPNVPVITIGAAINISYGNFQKRIINQVTLSRINEISTDIIDFNASTQPAVYLSANPVHTSFMVMCGGEQDGHDFNYALYDLGGTLLRSDHATWGSPIDVSNLYPGAYLVQIKTLDPSQGIYIRKFIKI